MKRATIEFRQHIAFSDTYGIYRNDVNLGVLSHRDGAYRYELNERHVGDVADVEAFRTYLATWKYKETFEEKMSSKMGKSSAADMNFKKDVVL
jgi:hypothetical protein